MFKRTLGLLFNLRVRETLTQSTNDAVVSRNLVLNKWYDGRINYMIVCVVNILGKHV